MTTENALKGRQRIKPRRHSPHTRKMLRCPEGYDATLIQRRFDEINRKYRIAGGFARFQEGQRIYLPDDLHNALLTLLEKVCLPIARYEQWCRHGHEDSASGMVWSVLADCGIYDDRDEKVAAALMAIEPFPSKKPVDRFRIAEVLSRVGDIWPAYRRADHQLACQ